MGIDLTTSTQDQNSNREPTNREILEAVKELGTRFGRLETENREILETMNEFATNVEGEMGNLKAEMGRVKVEILDGIDEKLGNLKGDLVVLTRKEDRKIVRLVEILRDKNILAQEEAKQILGMEPFPQLLI
ncbi:MAG: hypothetical protein UX98_C0005G0026 [Parcubacteria group bacterium GW2011_GWA2_47_26]|nr:MAG: hypothetical protein UX98_C0005G0026 [Parcubacteria group bacterium GW2011_GWA2_47_26]